MTTKIVFVTPDPSKVNEDAAIITRKQLNILLEAGWEVRDEGDPHAGVARVVLHKEDKALATQPPRHQGVSTLSHRMGHGPAPDPSTQLVSALEGIAGALSTGGSHLGGAVTRCIPGVTIVSSMDVGMARDAGVQAAMMGLPESENPWPKDSNAGHLWLEGYRMGSKQLDQTVEKDPSEYNEDEALAYRQGTAAAQGDDPEPFCPYRGGPLYLAWLRGFADHGGEIT